MTSKKKNGNTTLTIDDYAGLISSWLSDQKHGKDVYEGVLSEDEQYVVWTAPVPPAIVKVFIIGLKSPDPFLLIYSIVASLPDTGILPFYRRCLELNNELVGGNLVANSKNIALSTKRILSCLTLAELNYKLNTIFVEAPAIAKRLQSEFDIASASE
ncbi:MAG: hypothetical protein HY343_00080 [Lentisphaerae bacterium]|nr:hypothetical protein [Lentisphaerota bacterium]